MTYKSVIALGVLLMVGCAQDKPTKSNPDDDPLMNKAVPAGGYVPPANRPTYIDATDPNAFPPSPEQPAWAE